MLLPSLQGPYLRGDAAVFKNRDQREGAGGAEPRRAGIDELHPADLRVFGAVGVAVEGKLTFQSATEGATFVYNISDADVKGGEGSEVQLGVTYVISVYAKKDGYLNSETATATLCWIDVEPEQEGITDAVNTVKAQSVLVQRSAGGITVEGATPGTPIAVYDLSGKLLGSAQAADGTTSVAVSGREHMVVVRIGERSVKMSL